MTRKYYVEYCRYGLNITHSSGRHEVMAFDSKKERKAWLDANEYNGQNYVAQECTLKTAIKILGVDRPWHRWNYTRQEDSRGNNFYHVWISQTKN